MPSKGSQHYHSLSDANLSITFAVNCLLSHASTFNGAKCSRREGAGGHEDRTHLVLPMKSFEHLTRKTVLVFGCTLTFDVFFFL